jgi:hypothetical protein
MTLKRLTFLFAMGCLAPLAPASAAQNTIPTTTAGAAAADFPAARVAGGAAAAFPAVAVAAVAMANAGDASRGRSRR